MLVNEGLRIIHGRMPPSLVLLLLLVMKFGYCADMNTEYLEDENKIIPLHSCPEGSIVSRNNLNCLYVGKKVDGVDCTTQNTPWVNQDQNAYIFFIPERYPFIQWFQNTGSFFAAVHEYESYFDMLMTVMLAMRQKVDGPFCIVQGEKQFAAKLYFDTQKVQAEDCKENDWQLCQIARQSRGASSNSEKFINEAVSVYADEQTHMVAVAKNYERGLGPWSEEYLSKQELVDNSIKWGCTLEAAFVFSGSCDTSCLIHNNGLQPNIKYQGALLKNVRDGCMTKLDPKADVVGVKIEKNTKGQTFVKNWSPEIANLATKCSAEGTAITWWHKTARVGDKMPLP